MISTEFFGAITTQFCFTYSLGASPLCHTGYTLDSAMLFYFFLPRFWTVKFMIARASLKPFQQRNILISLVRLCFRVQFHFWACWYGWCIGAITECSSRKMAKIRVFYIRSFCHPVPSDAAHKKNGNYWPKSTGAKGYVCPGTFRTTGANDPLPLWVRRLRK